MDKVVMSGEKFEQLKSVIKQHREFLHRVHMPDLVRESLIKDMQKATTIIGTAKKGATNGNSEVAHSELGGDSKGACLHNCGGECHCEVHSKS